MKNTILLIEDDPIFATLIENRFKKDYIIIIKENGLLALEWLSSNDNPTIIIADLNMPVMNGYELISKLKSNPSLSRIPVIVISGEQDNIFLKNRCFRAGANKYFSKPVNVNELLLAIRELEERSEINLDLKAL